MTRRNLGPSARIDGFRQGRVDRANDPRTTSRAKAPNATSRALFFAGINLGFVYTHSTLQFTPVSPDRLRAGSSPNKDTRVPRGDPSRGKSRWSDLQKLVSGSSGASPRAMAELDRPQQVFLRDVRCPVLRDSYTPRMRGCETMCNPPTTRSNRVRAASFFRLRRRSPWPSHRGHCDDAASWAKS